MNKKELLKQYHLRQLEDPTVGEWEKKKLRRRYDILTSLEPDFFSKALDRANHGRVREFIEERIDKINQKHPNYEPSEALQAIVALWEFSSILESDGFWDYADKSPLKDKHLSTERESMLRSLKIIGLADDAYEIEYVWKNEYKNHQKLKYLQDRYWDLEFKADFYRRVFELIRASKDEILNLDKHIDAA